MHTTHDSGASSSSIAHARRPLLVTLTALQVNVIITALAAVARGCSMQCLPVLVVRTNACKQRITQVLAQAQLPMPDVLSLSHSQPYRQVMLYLQHVNAIDRHMLCAMLVGGSWLVVQTNACTQRMTQALAQPQLCTPKVRSYPTHNTRHLQNMP